MQRATLEGLFGAVESVRQGAEPNETIREAVGHWRCRDAIALVLAGTRVSACDWGVLPGHKFDYGMLWTLLHLGRLLEADARILAADGQYRAALEVCLAMRRFASHIGDATYIMYANAEGVDEWALRTMHSVVGRMPPDPNTLAWLRNELASTSGVPWRLEQALKGFGDTQRWFLQKQPQELVAARERVLSQVKDSGVENRVADLTPEEMLRCAVRSYDEFVTAASKTLGGSLSCKEVYAQLSQLDDQLNEKMAAGDPVSLLVNGRSIAAAYYRMHLVATARENALLVALTLYQVQSETGHLPDAIPAGLPKDPCGGGAFEYGKTAEGFVLRCASWPWKPNQTQEFEFRLH
ncbi:MAG: hypothetical protein KBE65_23405 [Phycisphaerae bacterium]|nr:hypothetical protein [Phycisphaerae bacterium]